jgi:potassium transporter
VPLILAALVYGVMLIWHLGANAVSARLQDEVVPVDAFMANIVEGSIPRVSGTAVFLTRTQRDAPPVMVWHIKHNRALHERLFVLTVTTESVPRSGTPSGLAGWLPALGTRGFHRPLSDPSTDLQVRCHGSECDGRDVPEADMYAPCRPRHCPLD